MVNFGFALLTLVLAFQMGCQQKPTLGVTESGVLVQSQDYRKAIQANSVVFDTRSPFEFNTNKVPGSINLPVQDFDVSKDSLDAARRLSLYGVNSETPVVIIGSGNGDEQKLAWEFSKLGLTKIETFNSKVFRMMNLHPEGSKKNVALWKPDSSIGEISMKEFDKRMNRLKPRPTSKARAAVFQGVPVGNALRDRVLVVTSEKEWAGSIDYLFADHIQLNTENMFDEKGYLNRSHLQNQKIDKDLKKYDAIFLIDKSVQRFARAYALAQFGAKPFYLVR